MSVTTVLIANRGAIATRIIRTMKNPSSPPCSASSRLIWSASWSRLMVVSHSSAPREASLMQLEP